ncbi:transposable element p transposase [Plakobranchus ocellatus]|uniref:Transposable element p transposase n=1 Tax=Plakobranchus ocellatus TaxID=259542 RepID=A0AAV4BQJ0_9GAST|nr:transposable element p transposase [Plakobranchus ocellatus]
MPSAQTLNKAIKNVYVKPGICANMMHLFEIKVSSMALQEKVCAILLDEMALKASLQFNPLDDQVEGFEDFGQFGRSPKHATHALVFMLRELSTKWKQPVSYYLSNGPVKAHMLVPLLYEVIRGVSAIGLVMKIVICDQGRNNRAMCSRLHITEEQPYFYCDSVKIFFMYDPPHLLKSIRNNLKLHGFIVNATPVFWSHIVKFYDLDCKSPIRMAPKLTSIYYDNAAIQSPPRMSGSPSP